MAPTVDAQILWIKAPKYALGKDPIGEVRNMGGKERK